MISTVNGCGLCNAEHPPVGQWAGGTDQIFPPTLFVSPLAASQGREDRVSSPGRPPGGSHGSGERRANFTGNKSSRAAPAPWDMRASWRIDVETKTAFPTSFFLSPLSFPIVFSFVRRKKKRYWLAGLRRQQGNTGLAAGCTVGKACLRRVFD